MVKLIGMLRKRTDLSRAEFIDYYENRHVPLISGLVPLGRDYRRNYTEKMRVNGVETDGPFDYDVVSELWFGGTEDYEAFAAAMRRPEILRQVVADEEQFLDRSASRILMVSEYRTQR